VIVDTSALLALFDLSDPAHDAVAAVIGAATEPLVVSPYVIAELDYIVLTRHGQRAEQAILAELAAGAWDLAAVSADHLRAALRIVKRYADQPIGVTDASLLVLAEERGRAAIATLDRRHFQLLRFSDGSAPALLP
jgi:predicted nucleic acid-binding protein